MTRLAITGSTGQLGRLAIDHLLASGVAPSEIVAVARSREKAAELEAKGVIVRIADYTDPESLETAFAGVERLLLISSSEVGSRTAQHQNVIDAARRAKVSHIAYTSVLAADSSGISLAVEHAETERLLAESELAVTVLRNGWYVENYLPGLAPVVEHGVLLGATGNGPIGAATREDFAAAAAVVLAQGAEHEGRTYELAADEPFTSAQLAEWIGDAAGTQVTYQDLTEAEYATALEGAGLPAPIAAMLASADAGIARGELASTSGHLRQLIGRATQAAEPVIRAAAEALRHPATA